MAENAGQRLTDFLFLVGAVSNAVALTLSPRPGYARISFAALCLGAGLMWVGVISNDNNVPRPGDGIALSLSGAVLGLVVAVPLGPLVFLGLASTLFGIGLGLPLAFSITDATITPFPALTAQLNSIHSMVTFGHMITSAGLGLALIGLVALTRRDAPPIIGGPKFLPLVVAAVVAVLNLIFWIIFMADNDSKDVARLVLSMVTIVSAAGGVVVAATRPSVRAPATIGFAVAALALGAATTLIGSLATESPRVMPTIAAAGVVLVRVCRGWERSLGGGGGESAEQSTAFKIATRVAPAALVLLILSLTLSSALHTGVFLALFGGVLGHTLTWEVANSHERNVFTAAVAFVVWASQGALGLSRAKGFDTYGQKGYGAMAFFGYAATVGGLLITAKLFFEGLNRFNLHKDEHTVLVADVPPLPPAAGADAPPSQAVAARPAEYAQRSSVAGYGRGHENASALEEASKHTSVNPIGALQADI